jgi:hypothetical protein
MDNFLYWLLYVCVGFAKCPGKRNRAKLYFRDLLSAKSVLVKPRDFSRLNSGVSGIHFAETIPSVKPRPSLKMI